MRIGTLARRTALSADTIRYYERLGLLAAPRRTPGGFRDYDARAVRALRFVQRAKALGFTLSEIKHLQALDADGHLDASAVRAFAVRRLTQLDDELVQLRQQRTALAELVEVCQGEAVTRSGCPILAALHREPGA